MGAFFTNIQIKNNPDDGSFEQKIIDYFTKQYLDSGYIIATDEKSADCSIIIANDKSSSWYSVYEETSIDLDLKRLKQEASVISSSLGITTIATLVSDSDYLYIGINTDGKEEHSIHNLNDTLTFSISESGAWNNLLTEGKTYDDIRSAFNEKQVLVERYLEEIAPLININPIHWGLSYEYFTEIMPDEGTKLHFVKENKEVQEPPATTNLSFTAYGSDYVIKEGESLTMNFHLASVGAASTCLQIILAGDAFEKDYLNPTIATVSIFGSENKEQVEFIKTRSTDNQIIHYAQLTGFPIPQGYTLSPSASMKEYKRYLEDSYKSTILIDIEIAGLKAGKTSFAVYADTLPTNHGKFGYIDSINVEVARM